MKAYILLPILILSFSPFAASAALPASIAPAGKDEPGKKEETKKDEKGAKKNEKGAKPDAKKADPKKTGPKKPPVRTDMVEEDAVALLKPYDKDGNFEIDVNEMEALEADFKKTPKGPLLQFDKGKDGALDMVIDRTGINVKLGAAAPKTKPAAKPAPAKKPDASKPGDKKNSDKARPGEKKPAPPADKTKPEDKPAVN